MIITISVDGYDILLEPRYDNTAKLFMPDTHYVDYEGGHKYYKLSPPQMRVLATNLIIIAKEVERLTKK